MMCERRVSSSKWAVCTIGRSNRLDIAGHSLHLQFRRTAMTNQAKNCSRRDFMKTSATAVASLSALSLGLSNRAYAAGSDRVRVGLIGCGGRGSGAATNCLEADDGGRDCGDRRCFPGPDRPGPDHDPAVVREEQQALRPENEGHAGDDVPGLRRLQEAAGAEGRGRRSDRDAGVLPSGAPGGGDPGGQERVHGEARRSRSARDAEDHRGRRAGEAERAWPSWPERRGGTRPGTCRTPTPWPKGRSAGSPAGGSGGAAAEAGPRASRRA